MAVAKDLGLDMDRLAKDMESPDVKTGLDETMQLADALQINGTPTFVRRAGRRGRRGRLRSAQGARSTRCTSAAASPAEPARFRDEPRRCRVRRSVVTGEVCQ